MKSIQVLKLIVFISVFTSCKDIPVRDNFIKDDMVFEYRYMSKPEKGKLEIIKKGSEKFDRLKWHINNILGFKKDDFSTIYPNYTLISNNLKILIDLRKIQLEYIDSSNSIVKFTRDISVDEFLDFRYLIEDNEWITDEETLFGEGKFDSGKYTFCGLVPEEVNYKYKVGYWKFWNQNRQLIAEGEFKIDSALALGRGGCSYMMKMSKVIPGKWKFYDSNGENMNTTIEQIFRIENAK
ncbi:hypothetical protein [Winogradskyella sp.]|uniref:hypothetical protein n=2 Tax=Winogradskyella sp. TaxID=1883156 RepID=UPI003512D5C9